MYNPIYLRLPNETSKAYQAFEVYRDMGPQRSIQKVGERLAKNPVALARLSKKYNWVARAHAFDVYVGQRNTETMVKEIVEMQYRQAQQAQAIQEIAMIPLQMLKQRIDNGEYPAFDENFFNMKTSKLADLVIKNSRMYKEAAKMERAARGLEEKRAQTISVTSDAGTMINGPEFRKSKEGLSEKIIDEKISGQKNSKAEDEKDVIDEKVDSSQESPENITILKRRRKVFFDEERTGQQGVSTEATEKGGTQ